MINLAVINLKDIIKFIKKCIVLLIILFVLWKVIGAVKTTKNISVIKEEYFSKFGVEKILDNTLIISKSFSNEQIKNENVSVFKKLLMSEIKILNSEEKQAGAETQENNIDLGKTNSDNNLNNSSLNDLENVLLPTKVIDENNKIDKFTDTYNSVKIKNESKYPLTQEMLTPDIDFSNKKNIIIYHTHTCESYTPTVENNYVASGNFRTIDLEKSVARVGTELTNYLIEFGFNVTHNTTYHDYPAYTGSYTRGLSTIQSMLANNNDTEFVIDLHRDALGNNSSYAPCVQIGDDVVAQVMFVMGSDGGGLEHPNWINNLKLAVKIQEKANEMYPGFFKPIILRDSRYNQHVANGACIIEVGATGNTLEECNSSMKYLANVIKEVMK